MSYDFFHHALEYWERKISFLPLFGKRAAFPWLHLTERHPVYGEIIAWFAFWAQRTHRYNIGLIMGRISGLIALDADSDATAVWIRKHLPHTEMRTLTGKGEHFLYQLPEGLIVPPRVRINGMALDVRGERSYVVGCPSIHPDSGRRYQRAGSWNLSEVPYFDPAWIDDPQPKSIPAAPDGAIRNGEKYILKIFAVSGSGGHNETFRAACRLRDAGYSPQEALAALKRWNATNAKPPWSDRELEHKVKSVFGTI